MPELPEVETVRRGLAPHVTGRRIVAVRTSGQRLRLPWPEGFGQALSGARIERLERRAKYLLWRLDGGRCMISHLGMSGRFTVLPPTGAAHGLGEFYFHGAAGRQAGPHDHLRLDLDDGTRLVYTDPRRFGFFDLCADPAAHPMLAKLGPEPAAVTAAQLAARLMGRRGPVKTALLDQAVIAGLGNIYVCEALFRARISPKRRAGALGLKRTARLVAAIHEVIAEAIAAGGSTLRDHARVDGEAGAFQQRFAVYDRAGRPCVRAACDGVVRRFTQAGRGTFHCPRCQR
ncbi:MAG TPA: bifunctional DNA-formamidopyrimidine glycosylase/DNA-(apurinic or apyrimidinic site) lyase [Thermopetrobacter sp.]|nr:bifunctional DNA-formamidopyrimidine glycosylase/DNA-(apurinic or apyrimidinic site) lyase [Thermopetrobacter sp.]